MGSPSSSKAGRLCSFSRVRKGSRRRRRRRGRISSAGTTREEALRVRELLQPRGVRKILLVVDGPGTVRAMAVFERVGFDVVPAPWSPDWNLDAAPEERLQSLRPLAMELVAWLYYRAMGYL